MVRTLQSDIEATVTGNDGDPDAGVDYRYWAFISYSHSDEKWARWLHTKLETYRLPRQLIGRRAAGGGELGARLFPIFRDRDDLDGGFDLAERIRIALHQSRFLIVVCSPRAAASAHVGQEIETFEGLGREHRVLCLIVDGEPNVPGDRRCLPTAVLTRRAADGTLVPCEPIAADVRPDKDGRANSVLKILANMLGVGFDDLKQRERKRQFVLRIKILAGAAVLSLLGTASYLLMLDNGARMPGGDAFRAFLDRHQMSLLRPVHDEVAIRTAARSMRVELSNRLLQAQSQSGWYATSFDEAQNKTRDVWILSQTAVGLLSAPESDAKQLHSSAVALQLPFDPGVPIESGGVKYGWLAHEAERNTLAVPGLWTTLALATAIRRRAYLDSRELEAARQSMEYAEEALTLYDPSTTGGWNLFPNQRDLSLHNPYATALAMMALLEMRRAELPWRKSPASRDRLIRQAFTWLTESFNDKATPAGWKASNESMSATTDGLTLQIYGRLLDAAEELDLDIPTAISRQMVRHLASLADRDIDFPVAGGEFEARIVDHHGIEYIARESINFAWHPWGIDCASRWLRSENARLAAPEERVAVERALGHLVVNLGPPAVARAQKDWTFIAAETLYALSAVPPLAVDPPEG